MIHSVGFIYVEGTVTGPSGKQADVRFLVDSGARYTVLPEAAWREIEVEPVRTQTFLLADGTSIERAIGHCQVELPQGSTPTPVVLGDPGDLALLGVITLEELGLVLHPFNREVLRMQAVML